MTGPIDPYYSYFPKRQPKNYPITCRVCKGTLGYRHKSERTAVFCDDCGWTYHVNSKGDISSAHKGKPIWSDDVKYLPE